MQYFGLTTKNFKIGAHFEKTITQAIRIDQCDQTTLAGPTFRKLPYLIISR